MNTKRAVYDITGTTHHSKIYVINDSIMSVLRIHVGRNRGLTDHKIPRCCDATRMYYAEKVTKKVTDIFGTSYSKK